MIVFFEPLAVTVLLTFCLRIGKIISLGLLITQCHCVTVLIDLFLGIN